MMRPAWSESFRRSWPLHEDVFQGAQQVISMSNTPANSRQKHRRQTPESKPAEAITVFWMMTTMATLIACLGAAFTKAIILIHQAPTPAAETVLYILLLITLPTGALGLGVTPLVYRYRRQPPPRGVTCFAVIVNGLPWGTVLLSWAFHF
jgi:hypothetical protein